MLDYKFLVDTFFVALSGAPTTILITVVSLLIAIPLGFLLALTRVDKTPFFNRFAQVYVSFVRGTPLIIQIFIIYNSVPILLTTLFTKLNIKINIYDLNPIWYAFIVFSLNTIAILSEVFRSAISTVNKGQLEAAQSVGLTNAQAYIK
ncbi:MAG TPA: ABC transporter permease subunit, partial [Clostridium sp.]